MTQSATSWPNTSELHVVNAGAMPSGISSNRSGPSKTGSSEWYERWWSNDVPRKQLNSVPASGNTKKSGGAWCVCLIIIPVKCTSNHCFTFVASLRISSCPGRCSIPQSVCVAARCVFIWPVSCKACTRCMATPTNIIGGASIVNAILWTVEMRTYSTLV